MSVHRGRERDSSRLDPTSARRDVSTSKKLKQDPVKERKSVGIHDKSVKTKPVTKTTAKTTAKPTAKDPTKSVKKKLNVDGGKTLEKHGEKKEPLNDVPTKKSSKTDLIYLNDVIEKRASKHREAREEEERKAAKDVKKPLQDQLRVYVSNRDDDRAKMKRDRTRTRTLSPTEIKQLLPSKMAAGDLKRLEEANGKIKAPETDESGDEQDEYENDFEDYESDFEEDESQSSDESNSNDENSAKRSSSDVDGMQKTESEESMTSDTPPRRPDSSTQWKQWTQKSHLNDIRVAVEKENANLTERRKSTTNSILKESQQSNQLSNEPFIDFGLAAKKQKQQKEATAARKRGRQLLEMITLDAISYNILEIPPISYETYMAIFAKSNTKQVHVQTNEDVLEEETQTEDIPTTNKWTQFPVDYLGRKTNDNQLHYALTKEERLGVGGDDLEEDEDQGYGKEVVISSKTNSLINFLAWSSQVMLAALERKSGNFLNLENMPYQARNLAFSDGYALLNTRDVSPLSNRSVTQLSLLSKTTKKLLTVHVQRKKQFQRCFLCVWSFRELSKPLKILVASNRVTCCTFGPGPGNFVLAGLADGSLCLWDLRESFVHHKPFSEDSKWIIQSPTFTTAGGTQENDHSTSVVAVRLLNETESLPVNEDFAPLQVCSLDGNGNLVIWSVIQLDRSLRTESANDMGLSHWGRLKLIKSSSFSVFESLREKMPNLYITCNDIVVNETEQDGFYIANSFGSVNHVSAYGSAMKPQFYVPSKQEYLIEAKCLEMCPFDGNYFLVGCGDGSIRLHSRHQERPLITLNSNVIDGERQTSVAAICWLNTRPCVIFSLDSKSRIYVWDLAVSDMYPEMSLLLTDKEVLSMKLLTDSTARQVPFIVLGTEDGSVEIHRLKKEYGRRTAAEIANERKMFLKYVRIL